MYISKKRHEYPYKLKPSIRKKAEKYSFFKRIFRLLECNILLPPKITIFPIILIILTGLVLDVSNINQKTLLVYTIIIIYSFDWFIKNLKSFLDFKFGLIEGIKKRIVAQSVKSFFSLLIFGFVIIFFKFNYTLLLGLFSNLIFIIVLSYSNKTTSIFQRGYKWIKKMFLTIFVLIKYRTIPEETNLIKLKNEINRISEKNDIEKVDKIFKLNIGNKTNKIEAFINDFQGYRAIFTTDNVLERFPTKEIKVILLHELGHIKYYNESKKVKNYTSYMLIFGLILSFILFADGLIIKSSREILYLLGSIYTVNTLSKIYYNFNNKSVEEKSDLFALKYCKDPKTYESAFKRLADTNLEGLKNYSIFEKLLSSHPSLLKRINLVKKYRNA